MKYFKAPLPFVGQKRFFLNAFSERLNELIPGDGDGVTILDVFGGSGLLAHRAKRLKPKARVIYNDLQGYTKSILNIDRINAMRAEIYEITKELGGGQNCVARRTPPAYYAHFGQVL